MSAKILLSVGILLVLSLGGCAAFQPVQPESHFKAVQT